MPINLSFATDRGAATMFFDRQPSQRDQRADFVKAADLAEMGQQTSRCQPADASNGLQTPPDGFQVRMGFEMGFDLALGGFEIGLEILDMFAHALLNASGPAPGFQAISLLPEHVLHVVPTLAD